MTARPSATLRLVAAAFAIATLTLTGLSGCCACSTSCSGCDPKTEYCLVILGTDPDGANAQASCTPLPAACSAAATCPCLEDAEAKTDAVNGVGKTPLQCTGSPASGLTLTDCQRATDC